MFADASQSIKNKNSDKCFSSNSHFILILSSKYTVLFELAVEGRVSHNTHANTLRNQTGHCRGHKQFTVELGQIIKHTYTVGLAHILGYLTNTAVHTLHRNIEIEGVLMVD